MALILRQNTVIGKASAVVYDTTCQFDSGYNESGYGGPNASPDLGAFVSATVEFTEPGSDTALPAIDVFPYLPNTSGAGFEITIADLGISEFAIGVWTVLYTATDALGNVYTTECKSFNTSPVQCCIDGKLKAIDPICEQEEFLKASHLERMLNAANSAFCKGEYSKADDILSYVNEQCNSCC